MKGVIRMSSYAKEIKDVIFDMSLNEIFEASALKDIQFSHIPDAAYYKVLERMTKYEQLLRLAKGVYCRPEEGNLAVDEQAVVDFYTKEKTGIVVGEALYKEKHIIDKENPQIVIMSNKLREEKKHIGNVWVEKIDIEITDETIPVVQALEILQNYNKIENRNQNRFLAYMKFFAEHYSDDVTKYVIENKKYKKSTVAFMQRMLSWHGVDNSLDQYLSALSEYKIPTITEMREEVPHNIREQLEFYVQELKKIYRDSLQRVVLYGSYARGDYSKDSDVDVMILLNMPDIRIKDYSNELRDITYEFNVTYEIEINPIAKDKEEFEKWNTNYPFYANIQRDGVILYDAA